MANITDKQMQVLIKIIGAVETGGQVYGNARYDAYIGAGHNTSNETSITIGAFQEYHWHAKALLQEILDTYPKVFRKYDDAGIETALKKSSWEGYSPATTSAQANAIRKIISTSEGRKIQDLRIERLLKEYIAFAEKQGVSDVDALFMCANFIHQGGQGACTRILKKTPKPYTLDNLYNACKSDTGNQVGAYKTRQQKVYGWLKEKVSNTSGGGTNMVTTQQIIDAYVDFMVRMANDNTHGYSQAVRSLYNITNPTSFDCSSLTCTAIYYAFKKFGISPTPKDLGCTYTGNMLNLLKCGFEVVATNQTAHSQMVKGDIELNTIHHVAVAVDKDSIVHARSSEGTSNTRDDSGNEIRIQPWYLYGRGWTHRLRFTGKGLDLSNATPDSGNKVSAPNTTYNTPWVGKCTADDVNVRTGAGINYPNASWPKLNKDNRMDVLGETGEWYYVNIQGNKGYISKKYVAKVTSSSSGNNSTPTKSNKIIKNGQIHANNFTGAGISADGIRGADTIKAAKKVLQQGLNLDYRAGLEIDGEVGILTHRALGNHYVEYGEKQYLVTVLEILLLLRGYETNGVESPGVYGSGLKSAVKKWAADNGLSVNSNGQVTATMFLKLVQ